MTNAEKYLKEGEAGNFAQAFSCWYYGITRELENADKMLVQFLKAETKPTLTEDERVILRNIKEYNYIGREEDNDIYVRFKFSETYTEKHYCNMFRHLFQFIKERRRIFNRGVVK